MLTANVRLYGDITTQADGTVALTEEHAFPGVRDADAGREPGTIYAYLDLDPIGPNEDGARSGSSLDLHGTLDDYRALVANLQSFITDNEVPA